MPWVTVIWSMIASACLTLAAIYALIWYREPHGVGPSVVFLDGASAAAFAFCELWMMRAETPGELLTAMRWAHVPLFCLARVAHLVRADLPGCRAALARMDGLRPARVLLLLNFLVGPSVNYREVPSLRHVRFLGESVTVHGGVPNPWTLIGQVAALLLLIFVADASVTAWRRGDRRKALMVGGSVAFFLLVGSVGPCSICWADVQVPIVFSLLYLGMVVVMGYELSRDVLRASQLVHELQASEAGLRESEARMSLAVDAADFGIWIWDLVRNEIWASDKWRDVVRLRAVGARWTSTPSCNGCTPTTAKRSGRLHARAIAGSNGGRYQTEYRLMLPDGATRWISSRGRVECRRRRPAGPDAWHALARSPRANTPSRRRSSCGRRSHTRGVSR